MLLVTRGCFLTPEAHRGEILFFLVILQKLHCGKLQTPVCVSLEVSWNSHKHCPLNFCFPLFFFFFFFPKLLPKALLCSTAFFFVIFFPLGWVV